MNLERTSANENVLFVIPCHNVTLWMIRHFPTSQGNFPFVFYAYLCIMQFCLS